ncbi:MAG: cupin domain-containing protein [Hyphomicrobiales bacterium]|nr:cupin domain-containing protein [Hyphomicrobiales bacterium]
MVGTIRIDTEARPDLDDPIAAEKIVSGRPLTGIRAAHDDEGRGFWSGVWASSVGAWRVAYDEIELCVMLEGRVRLTGDDGSVAEYAAGESFVIPKGFSGVWETLEPARKIYAVVA